MPQSALQFGSFILDLDRLCLRGAAGEIDLRPKSFDVLLHLLRHSGNVVLKETLLQTVWPDVIVTDDSDPLYQRGAPRSW